MSGRLLVANLVIILALIHYSICGGVTDQFSGISSKSISAFVEKFSSKYVGSHVPGISVSVVKDGKTIYSGGYGNAERSKSVEMTGSTPIRVGGLTQLITLIAIMQQKDADRVTVSDPIDTFFPSGTIPKPAKYAGLGGSVTIANTLAHAGGWEYKQMGVYAPQNRVPKNTSMLMTDFPRRIRAQGHAPITYSYHGYAALGEIVSRVTEQDFVEYVQENIFEPLKMQTATVRGHDRSNNAEVDPALGYSSAGTGFLEIDVYGTSPASSGLCASASDMSQVLKVFTANGKVHGNTVISKKSVAECFDLQVPAIPSNTNSDAEDGAGTAFGWFKVPLKNESGHVWLMPGDAPGFTSFAAIFPSDRIGLFFAGNGESNGLCTEFLNEFAAEFSLPKERVKPVADRKKSAKGKKKRESNSITVDLSTYIGYYKPSQSSQTMWEIIAQLTSQIRVSQSPNGNSLHLRGINVDELTIAQVTGNMKKIPNPIDSSSGHGAGLVELVPIKSTPLNPGPNQNSGPKTVFKAVSSASGDEFLAAIYPGGSESNAPDWYLTTNSLGHHHLVTYQRISYFESAAFVLPATSLALSIMMAYTVLWLVKGMSPLDRIGAENESKPSHIGRLFNITAYACLSHLLFVSLLVTGIWKTGGIAEVLALQRLPIGLRFVFFGSFVCMNFSMALGVNIIQERQNHSMMQVLSSSIVFLASIVLMVVHYQMRLWILNV